MRYGTLEHIVADRCRSRRCVDCDFWARNRRVSRPVRASESRSEAPKKYMHTKFHLKFLFDFYLIKYWQRHAAKTVAMAPIQAHPVVGSQNS